MRTIVHPCPSLQPYNRLLQYLDFPISLCCSIQNLYITALMIAHSTPNLVDSVVWIVPVVLGILFRPALSTYVHGYCNPRQAELALVSHFMMAVVVGCCLVAASAHFWHQEYPLNVVMCAMGFTCMDLGCEMVAFYGHKTKQRLGKYGYGQIDGSVWGVMGSVLGYLVGWAWAKLEGGRSMKKFMVCSASVYWCCAAVCAMYWLLLCVRSADKHSIDYVKIIKPNNTAKKSKPKDTVETSKPKDKEKDTTDSKEDRLQVYLPGYYELKRCQGSDRGFLALHFMHNYVTDTLLIYGSMWAIWDYQQRAHKQGFSYCKGMQHGALVLLIYVGCSSFNLLHRLTTNLAPSMQASVYRGMLVWICVLACVLYASPSLTVIYALAGSIGVASSFYSSILQPQLEQNLVYEACMEIVERVEKIFILCPMPFFVMILLRRDDIQDCLVALVLVVIAGLAVNLLSKDKSSEFVAAQKTIKQGKTA